MIISKILFVFALGLISCSSTFAKIKVLLLDGQNNHNWKATTPVLIDALERNDGFDVTVLTSPP